MLQNLHQGLEGEQKLGPSRDPGFGGVHAPLFSVLERPSCRAGADGLQSRRGPVGGSRALLFPVSRQRRDLR